MRKKVLLGLYDTEDNNVLVMIGTYDEVAEAYDKPKKYIKALVTKKNKLFRRYSVERLGIKEGDENE